MPIEDFSKPHHTFKWIDVVDPTEDDIKLISTKYHLHRYTLRDCLEPDHLPKDENIGNMQFVITRMLTENLPKAAHTVQEISTKIVIFYNADIVITIHRLKQPFLKKIYKNQNGSEEYDSSNALVTQVVWHILQSYDQAALTISQMIDDYEELVFLKPLTKELLRELYLIRRKASVCLKLLMFMREVINRIPLDRNDAIILHDLKDLHLKLITLFEQSHEDSTHLLDIYLSLSSRNSNEVMKVLTIFSVFLMPPTFIVGLYGMNFDFMPELHYKWSYPAVLLLIVLITVIIYFWFKRKRWL